MACLCPKDRWGQSENPKGSWGSKQESVPVWGYWLSQPEALHAQGRAWLSVRCEGHTTH